MPTQNPRGRAKVPQKQRSKSADKITESAPKAKATKIVAIGASAGGLDPFERFFDAIPKDTGMAFVIIQHLSPNFKSMMDELLARHSDMDMHRIEEGTEIVANAVYLNQPRLSPTLENGVFKLIDNSDAAGLNLPINTFFESLARERGEDAIGVILSGTGSDGTIGCEAIKYAGGIVLVQEPSTAKFDGMPNSVINKKIADAIADPEGLAELVLRHTQGESIRSSSTSKQELQSPIDYIFTLITQRYGTDFRIYKPSTVERRIRRRYEMCGLNNFQDYADLVSTDREEMAALYNDLLIDVTAFFRDGDAFDLLDEKVIQEIASRMSETNQIRIWVAACSSGEEPYSIAMLVADYARKHKVPLNLKILATDIHHGSLEAASTGVYSEENMKSISSERIGRYFLKQGRTYHIRPELRKLVVFTPHSLFRDPPFTRLDLVSCRNMLIYLKEPAQNKAMALFHFALNKNGFLFLGPSETVGKLGNEFNTVDQRWRIYQKKRDIRLLESTTVLRTEAGQPAGQNPFNTSMPRASGRDGPIQRPEARRAFSEALQSLLSEYAPPGFLTDLNGDLVHTFGSAGKYIIIGEGGFSHRLTDLLQPDLRLAVIAGLERIRAHITSPFQRRTKMKDAAGNIIGALLKIESLPDKSGVAEYLLVTILPDPEISEPEGAPASGIEYIQNDEATALLQMKVKDLERDLASTEESLQSTIEELETSNEELQATNEELMASNEELQSTNEELHSVNEELYTVSAEHQRKIEELTDLTNDMDQLLRSTNIGTVFLSHDLKIRRFTPAATETFNLMSQDTNRPFEHITHKFDTKEIMDMIRGVQASNKVLEREFSWDNLHYLVRILPYQPTESEPSGIVITILDITEISEANKRIASISKFSQSVLSDIDEFIVRWRADDYTITYVNEPYAKLAGRPADAIHGQRLNDFAAELGVTLNFADEIGKLKSGDRATVRLVNNSDDGDIMYFDGKVRAIGDEAGEVVEFQASTRDATHDVRYLEALEALIDRNQFAADDFDARMEDFLKTGCSFLGLENALLSEQTPNGLRTISYIGAHAKLIKTGTKSLDAKNPSQLAVKETGIVKISDVVGSPFKKRSAIRNNGICAYIGAPIHKDAKPYGSVCFYSTQEAHPREFTSSEIGFIMLLARWIGYKVERKAQIEALKRNENELKFIFDSIPIRIWYKDDKNRILRLNQTAADSMNLDIDVATGADTYDLFPEMAKKYHDDDLSVLNSGKPRQGIIEEYTPLDGKRGWVSTDKIPFEDFDSGDRNLLVVATDVTALKQQELDVQILNNELKQANDGLRQFAYVASHDLQEPLRKIRQFSEILVETYTDQFDEDGKYFLSVVSESATRMSALIKDLLNYSKTSYREFDREEIDLSALMSDVLASLKDLSTAAGCKTTRTKLPTISGDRTMIEQLFSNLIGNAIKYRHPDKNPQIKISSRTLKTKITIVISDNGIGLEQKYLQRIFEPFTRLKNGNDVSGTGIGLAICKSVCERHGWQIEATSTVGEGSKFTISIPLDTRAQLAASS